MASPVLAAQPPVSHQAMRAAALPVRSTRLACRLLVLAAALFALSFSPPAAAKDFGCSLDDLIDAGKDTYNNAPVACGAQLENPAFYALTAFLIGAIQAPEGKAFCNNVFKLNASVENWQQKLADYWGYIPANTQEEIKKGIPAFGSIQSNASEANLALQTAVCACKIVTWEGPGALGKELGQCAATGLCAMQDFAAENFPGDWAKCSSAPPPAPQMIDCKIDPKVKDPVLNWDLKHAYVGGGAQSNCSLDKWIAGPYAGQYDPHYQCEGDFCFSESVLKQGTGNYCYCPKAMQPKAPKQFDHAGGCTAYLICACPGNSQPLSQTGAGAYICMCPDSGMPVNADGTCPKKCDCGCANNQVLISKDYKSCTCNCGCPDGKFKLGDSCVSPCANAGDVMLAGGVCCSAGQATSCGSCCPLGMKPGAGGLTCVSALMPEAPKTPVQQPKPGILQKLTP